MILIRRKKSFSVLFVVTIAVIAATVLPGVSSKPIKDVTTSSNNKRKKKKDKNKCSLVIGSTTSGDDSPVLFPSECDEFDSISLELEDGSLKTFSKKHTSHQDGYKTKKKKGKNSNGRYLTEVVDVAGSSYWYGEESSRPEAGNKGGLLSFSHTETGLLNGQYVDLTTDTITMFSVSSNGTMAYQSKKSDDFKPESEAAVPNKPSSGDDEIVLRRDRELVSSSTSLQEQQQKQQQQQQQQQGKMLRGFQSQIENPSSLSPEEERELQQTTYIFDLLVVWTDWAECYNVNKGEGCNRDGNSEDAMRNKINQVVEDTNTAYLDSGINVHVRLVHAYCDEDYDNKGRQKGSDQLNDVTDNKNGLGDVDGFADEYGADLIAFITYMSDYCGIAWRPTPPLDNSHKGWMYSATSVDCLGGYTLQHELGHNFGCHHDRETSGDCNSDLNDIEYGYASGDFVTIMSYRGGELCNGKTKSTARVPRHANWDSSGTFNFDGKPTGSENERCAENINRQAEVISGYRDPPFTDAPTESLAPSSEPTYFPTSSPTTASPTISIMPSGRPTESAMPTDFPPDWTVIDYDNFDLDRFGAYWKNDGSTGKAAEIKENKYVDAVDPSGPPGFFVKLKEDAAMTATIDTSTYTSIQLSFYLMFKKMEWNNDFKTIDSLNVEYSQDGGSSYTELMLIDYVTNTQFAANNEGSWYNITGLEIPVNGHSSMILRIRIYAFAEKGEGYVDHTMIVGVRERTPSPTPEYVSEEPSFSPTKSQEPSMEPSLSPSDSPSSEPSLSFEPSFVPTGLPTKSQEPSKSNSPSESPSSKPSLSSEPSKDPTDSPTKSQEPSLEPTFPPTDSPSSPPSRSSSPSSVPTVFPSESPSREPSVSPTKSLMPTIGTPAWVVIDYDNFDLDQFGAYWKNDGSTGKAAEIKENKYVDAVDPSGPPGFFVKLKEDAAMTATIDTSTYTSIQLSFYLMFKKMEWNNDFKTIDSLNVEYSQDGGSSYTELMLIDYVTNTQFAANNEGSWYNITGLEIPVNGHSSMILRIRIYAFAEKGEGYVDHTLIQGTVVPTPAPTPKEPTDVPSVSPTKSQEPSMEPSLSPSGLPSSRPSVSLAPSEDPTIAPTATPVADPSEKPSTEPSRFPSSAPTTEPSSNPSLSLNPSSGSPLEVEIDYQDFQNESYGSYWGPFADGGKVEVKSKYDDHFDATIDGNFGVKIKGDAGMYTVKEIVTTSYDKIRVDFFYVFKKMVWKKDADNFWIEYNREDGPWAAILSVGIGESDEALAINDESQWLQITREVAVENASSMRLRLRMRGTDKGETHIDHLKIIGIA